MTVTATVVLEKGSWNAEVIRGEACAKCRACSFGQTERVLYPLPEGEYREGEAVLLELEDRVLTKAALLAYGLPFAAALIGLALGHAVFRSELFQALTCLLFTGAGLAVLYVSEKKRRKNGAFTCKVTTIQKI